MPEADDDGSVGAIRMIMAFIIILFLVAFVAKARGEPGNGNRSPDPGDSPIVVVHPARPAAAY